MNNEKTVIKFVENDVTKKLRKSTEKLKEQLSKKEVADNGKDN